MFSVCLKLVSGQSVQSECKSLDSYPRKYKDVQIRAIKLVMKSKNFFRKTAGKWHQNQWILNPLCKASHKNTSGYLEN